jgi:predicted transcriptional regulator
VNTEEYIINDIAPFNINTNILEVQSIFNQLTYSHIPVKKEGLYIGCISENDAHCFDGTGQLNDYIYALESFFRKRKNKLA